MLIQEYLEDNILAPELKHVQSYKEAFNALTDPEIKPFDVILLDLTLPDRSGGPFIHEIISIGVRAPIARLMGLSELILERDNSADQLDKLVGHIVDSTNELDTIIRDITTKAQQANQEIRADLDVSDFKGLV